MPLFEKIVILYGTETGNSQDLSKIIAWQLSRLDNGIKKIEVMSCDDYPIQRFPEEKFILIICSTCGLGDTPLNMKLFWRFLMRKDLPNDCLSQLSFGVIGLGDSSYAKYNFVAKKLFKRLLFLGAKNLLELVLGDEQHEFGPFYTIDPWLREFYTMISSSNVHKLLDDESLISSSFRVILLDAINVTGDVAIAYNQKNLLDDKTEYNQLNPFEAKIIENKRITSEDHFQDVRLIELALDSTIQYKVTDVCVVYPENYSEEVDLFFSLFSEDNNGKHKLNENQLIKLELNESQHWIPQSSYYFHLLKHQNPCSLRDVVRKYMDINSIPKRSFFDLFYRFSQDHLEREKLKRYASGIDLDELYDYVNRPKRTILEVMADFPHTTPYVPVQYLFDLIPSMAWRSYSIANSPLVNPSSVKILYAVVKYRTRLKKPRLGQCTNWMVKQEPNMSSLSIFLRSSTFKLRTSHEQPIIMIAAGTGIAPFRAFIEDRTKQNIGNNYLFFGCRFRKNDYFFQEEWQPLIERKLLSVFVAFSREDPDRKVYVQHIVWQQRDLVFDMFANQNGTIFIAGKSKQYPESVRKTLTNIFKEKLKDQDSKTDDKYFENMINRLESQKRIQFECW